MNIVIAFILLLLFAFTIKTLPRHFSKQKWEKEMIETLEKLKNQGKESGIPPSTVILASVILVGLFDIFLVIFYTHLGTISNNAFFMILSLLEAITCAWNLKTDLDDFQLDLSMDINDYKYHKVQLILNSVLDLIYYPMAIYFVLCN